MDAATYTHVAGAAWPRREGRRKAVDTSSISGAARELPSVAVPLRGQSASPVLTVDREAS